MAYWQDRLERQQQAVYNRTEKDAKRRIASLYKAAAEGVADDIARLLATIQSEDVLVSDLYRNNHYYEMLNKINARLRQLGQDEITILSSDLLDAYAETSKAVSNELHFNVSFAAPAEDVVNRIWCPDGKHFSSRIWTNKAKMTSLLEQGLVDTVSRGLPKDRIVKDMMDLTGNQFYQADRIVRTELTYIQNEAASDTYKAAGVEQYEYLAALDDRTSDQCRRMNGKRFYFAEKQVGVNFPPLHANCRCTILPIIKK